MHASAIAVHIAGASLTLILRVGDAVNALGTTS
jgi:hypothetical protein